MYVRRLAVLAVNRRPASVMSRQLFPVIGGYQRRSWWWRRRRFRPPPAATTTGLLSCGVLATVKSLLHDPRKDDDRKRIADQVRDALAAQSQGRTEECLDLLHTALAMAKRVGDERAVTYIYDVLANVYYGLLDLEKAKSLFLAITERLISSGCANNDPAIVEISLKLADIYAMQGDHALAEQGYQFCLNTQNTVVNEMEKTLDKKWLKVDRATRPESTSDGDELIDPFALYGMILEAYSRYLVRRDRVDESQKYFRRALELARDIYSPLSAQIIVMMNNYAIECTKRRHYQLALTFYKEVAHRAVHCIELADELPAFYCNYAEALWHCDQKDEALRVAERALTIASEGSNQKVLDNVRQYVQSLRSDPGRKDNKKK